MRLDGLGGTFVDWVVIGFDHCFCAYSSWLLHLERPVFDRFGKDRDLTFFFENLLSEDLQRKESARRSSVTLALYEEQEGPLRVEKFLEGSFHDLVEELEQQ